MIKTLMKCFPVILVTLLSMLLTACVAGAFVAGGAATGVVATDKRPIDTMNSDYQITYQATKAISADTQLSAQAHIVVAAYNGVVLLTGQAPTEELQTRAVQLVQSIPQIRRLYNEITIGKPTSPLVRSNDALITTNVKARMVTTTNLTSGNFKVVTENGTVFLLGTATHQQAEVAANIASQSTGVKRVVKLIEYLHNSQQ